MSAKKFTIKTLMESIPESHVTDLKLTNESFKDVSIQVQSLLSLEDAMGFVRDITATCVDNESAEYMPELFDFAVRMYVVMYYASIDLSKDVKKAYRVLYGTTLFEQVYECINKMQFTALINSAEKKIEHIKTLISSSLASKVSEMMSKLDNVMQSGREVVDIFNSDEFKSTLARLTEAGIPGLDEHLAEQTLTDETESLGTADTSDNIVYVAKKK